MAAKSATSVANLGAARPPRCEGVRLQAGLCRPTRLNLARGRCQVRCERRLWPDILRLSQPDRRSADIRAEAGRDVATFGTRAGTSDASYYSSRHDLFCEATFSQALLALVVNCFVVRSSPMGLHPFQLHARCSLPGWHDRRTCTVSPSPSAPRVQTVRTG